jgi:hypothetical protein
LQFFNRRSIFCGQQSKSLILLTIPPDWGRETKGKKMDQKTMTKQEIIDLLPDGTEYTQCGSDTAGYIVIDDTDNDIDLSDFGDLLASAQTGEAIIPIGRSWKDEEDIAESIAYCGLVASY